MNRSMGSFHLEGTCGAVDGGRGYKTDQIKLWKAWTTSES